MKIFKKNNRWVKKEKEAKEIKKREDDEQEEVKENDIEIGWER